ncbi:MAG: hypothetical protein HRT36_06910 [Alphaproteobacteria bacterium]|nr:hypothetical protein [Alphaproteobacteria bacterium]
MATLSSVEYLGTDRANLVFKARAITGCENTFAVLVAKLCMLGRVGLLKSLPSERYSSPV